MSWGTSWGSSWGASWTTVINLDVTDTDAIQLPVDYHLAGDPKIRQKGGTYEKSTARDKTSMVARMGGAMGGKTSFTTRTSNRGYE